MIKGNPLTRPRVAATREQVDIEKHFIFAPRRHPAIARSRIYPRFVALVASLGGSSTETDSASKEPRQELRRALVAHPRSVKAVPL